MRTYIFCLINYHHLDQYELICFSQLHFLILVNSLKMKLKITKKLKHKAPLTLDQCSLNITFNESILPQNMKEPKMKCRYKMYST